MKKRQQLKICLMGGKQAGLLGALTVLALGDELLSVVCYSADFEVFMEQLKVPVYKSVKESGFAARLKESDVLLSVHGREIVTTDLLNLPRLGSINVHPYLYQYKGADPVGRALQEKNFNASVGVHRMTQKVDEGDVIVEEFINVSGAQTVDEIYNKLYPGYCQSILKALNILRS